MDATSEKVRRLASRVASHFDAFVSPAGVKTSQLALLATIARLSPVRAGDLALAMKIAPSTLSRNLAVLESAGWVRSARVMDGRTRMLELTPAGRDKCIEAQRYHADAQRLLVSRLGADRVSTLHAVVDDFLHSMEGTPTRSPSPADRDPGPGQPSIP